MGARSSQWSLLHLPSVPFALAVNCSQSWRALAYTALTYEGLPTRINNDDQVFSVCAFAFFGRRWPVYETILSWSHNENQIRLGWALNIVRTVPRECIKGCLIKPWLTKFTYG
jgi:hypothetical protein